MRKRQRSSSTFVSSFTPTLRAPSSPAVSPLCRPCCPKLKVRTPICSSATSPLPPGNSLTPAPQPSEYDLREMRVQQAAHERSIQPCVLVGVEITSKVKREEYGNLSRLYDMESSLEELRELCKTAGLRPVATVTQSLSIPDASTFIKSGKLSEIRSILQSTGCCTVVFDFELSPSQLRNIEEALSNYPSAVASIIDRTALILDIFSKHAQSKEGKLQVELALYQYRLPRLTRLWTHLEKQSQSGSNTIGLKGPGETQLEIDRRLILRRVNVLQKQIHKLKAHRSRLKQGRSRSSTSTATPLVSIVGYTNVGKSTLLNCLSGRYHVRTENKLFATVDPTTRRVHLGTTNVSPSFLVTDTVGFIQNLPTQLVAAFQSTLEEIKDSSLLVHVVDGGVNSRDIVKKQIESVDTILKDVLNEDFDSIPVVIALNKMDRVNYDANYIDDIKAFVYSLNANIVSVVHTAFVEGVGVEQLAASIEEAIRSALVVCHLFVPWSEHKQNGALKSTVHVHGCVLDEFYTDDGIRMLVKIPRWMIPSLEAFIIKDPNDGLNDDFIEDGDDIIDLDSDDNTVANIPGAATAPYEAHVDKEEQERLKWTDLAKKRHVPRTT